MNNTLLGFSTIAIIAIVAFLFYFGWNDHNNPEHKHKQQIWITTIDHSVGPNSPNSNNSFFLVNAKGKKELQMHLIKGHNFQSASTNAAGNEAEITPNKNTGIKSIRIRQQAQKTKS